MTRTRLDSRSAVALRAPAPRELNRDQALSNQHINQREVGPLRAVALGPLQAVVLSLVDDRVRRRLGMQPVVLTDEALARVEALSDEPATTALAALSVDQAAAVRGRIVDEREYEDLARDMRCSESVVRQRVSRGLRAMKSSLEDSR